MFWSPSRVCLLLVALIADLVLLAAVSATEAGATVPDPHGPRVVAEE
ncbi:hypothetical protein [Streptomyces sp. TRM68367]|nr:hypothetical protein [Streptomyces sp. TRM68367]MBC9727760.1 hypothetical protein [Streptomyces sp. TRM68367]